MPSTSFSDLEELIKSDNPDEIRTGLLKCIDNTSTADHEAIPVEWLFPYIESTIPELSRLAIKALAGKKVPIQKIEEWIGTGRQQMLQAAMSALSGREDAPAWLIEEGLLSKYTEVSSLAAEAVIGMKIPFPIIEKWAKSYKLPFRIAATKACYGRKFIPASILNMLVHNSLPEVRKAAAPLARL